MLSAIDRHHVLGIEPVVHPICPMLHQLRARLHIIIMPPQHIIMGMPICIMLVMLSQHFMNMSFMDGSTGVISQVMPVGVMVYFIWHAIIIGIPIMFIIGIMPPAMAGFIMPPIIIGMGIICIAVFIVILQGPSRKHSFALPKEIK